MEHVVRTTSSTVAKVEQLCSDLCHEFPETRAEHVHELMGRRVDQLLHQAHFDDYVPLLAYRHARERIRDEVGRGGHGVNVSRGSRQRSLTRTA